MKLESSELRKIIVSAMSLLLIVLAAVSLTVSWSEGGDKAQTFAKTVTVNASSALTMKQDGVVTDSVNLPDTAKLREVSSADGINFFYPDGNVRFDTTSNMHFRKCVSEDINKSYISIDFQLVAGNRPISVYLADETAVQCDDSLKNALRIAIFKNDGTAPTVFDPSLTAGASDYSPISSVSSDGTPTISTVSAKAFAKHRNLPGNSPLFNIAADETVDVTLMIWLEGTKFSGNAVANTDFNVCIGFESVVG